MKAWNNFTYRKAWNNGCVEGGGGGGGGEGGGIISQLVKGFHTI